MRSDGTIIVYHAIGDQPEVGERNSLFVSTEKFREQLLYLHRHREVVSLAALLEGGGSGSKHRVAITFDDGFRGVLTHALPVLEELGFPATAFITSRWLDDTAAAPTDELWNASYELLNEADVAAIADRGVEIGSHGHTHSDLERLSLTIVESDLLASRDRLAEIIGRPPRYLAWPYGSSTAEARRTAERIGFEAAFTMDYPTLDRFSIERVPIYPYDGDSMFALKTSGKYVGARRSGVVRASYAVLGPVVRSLRDRRLRRSTATRSSSRRPDR